MKTSPCSLNSASRPLPRTNPFATRHLHRLAYRFDAGNLQALRERFQQLHEQAALVGLHGHGKTTLLEEFARQFEQAQRPLFWIRLREGDRQLPPSVWQALRQEFQKNAAERSLILLDGAEQLSWWQWRRFRKHLQTGQSCLITSHRPGLLPTLLVCETSAARLIELVEALQGKTSAPQKWQLERLFQQHQGDLRLCFRDLYDLYMAGQWVAADQS